MREILFRIGLVANKDHNGYKKGEEINLFNNLFDENNGVARFSIDKGWDVKYKDQFTGLPDKNGENIFERDIVTDGNTTWLISWHQQGCKWYMETISTSDDIDGIFLEILDNQNLGNGYLSRSDLEVIGNIHKNPELLNSKP